MVGSHRVLLALLAPLLVVGCRSTAPPVLLYEGPPRPPGEIAILEIVRDRGGQGSPTVDVRKITRMSSPQQVVFQGSTGNGWSIPGHFAGPPDNQATEGRAQGTAIPHHFELPPGTYRFDVLFTPALDHLGWKHTNSELQSTSLECMPGRRYLLEGRYVEEAARWVLSAREAGPIRASR
jgi:hypothetical protein